MLLPVLAEGSGREELREEVEGAAARVDPGGVEPHQGPVPERRQEADLAVEAVQVAAAAGASQEVVEAHLVPRHLDALPLVEPPVHGLCGALAENLVVPAVSSSGIDLRIPYWRVTGLRQLRGAMAPLPWSRP